ncbi:signal recognition particle receptor beta subunit-domain-containing protein [Pelagophyceae sp. CCMP2097]|nr:signal recognition particle receptor beta subunit-domain-containing protein [Pelagophyceae sp. CCMP2097]|mmetsp:Transcript_10894/g.36365  ORF Transcript_10894/g.36365 Transcript_10894/m.36365 type:complete len:233 (+) Transcript_10894:66-764(+)
MSFPVVVLLLLLVALFLFFFVLSPSKGSSRSCVMLVGPVGGGKTCLFHKLLSGEAVETVSSMVSREASVPVGGRDAQIVDFPGHERLRGPLFKEAQRAVGIVFVIDSAAMTVQARPAAELLYDLLTSPDVAGRKVPISVICNKSDKPGAKTPQRCQLILMNELQTLRKTCGTIETMNDGGSADKLKLGRDGQVFSFEHCENAVTFSALSAKADEAQTVTFSAVKAFIAATRA